MNKKHYSAAATDAAAKLQELLDENADEAIRFFNKTGKIAFKLGLTLEVGDESNTVDVMLKLEADLEKIKGSASTIVDDPEQGQLLSGVRGRKPKGK